MIPRRLKTTFELLKETFLAWFDSKTPRLGAALAYYTVFALAPLFLIALAIAGFCFGEEAARRELFGQISALVGREGGEAIQSIISAAGKKSETGVWTTGIAIVTLLAGASAVFVELQDALNTIWHVQRTAGGGLKRFIRDRLLSFAMIFGVGFLLLVSLVLSATLAALGNFMAGVFPERQAFWSVANYLVSLGVITLLFAMIFKVLPDVKIAWRDVWIGGFITALLFNVGKAVLGLYLGRSSVGSAYGAAGSLVVVLLWVYYSTQILFFGAEFTRVFAIRSGSHFTLIKGAQFVEVKEVKTARAKSSRTHPPKTKAG